VLANFELNTSGTAAHAITNTSGRAGGQHGLAETYEHIQKTQVRSWVKMLCVLSIELYLFYFLFRSQSWGAPDLFQCKLGDEGRNARWAVVSQVLDYCLLTRSGIHDAFLGADRPRVYRVQRR
jgi:hypothetical protein